MEYNIARILSFVFIAGIVYLFYKSIRSVFGGRGRAHEQGSLICPACGTRGEPKTTTRGHILIELILWLCLLIPGLIYSIWRLSTRQKCCPACGQPGMIPSTFARLPRSSAVLSAFKQISPCPANRTKRGPCPGWQIDHRVPLKCNGIDAVENLQWLSTSDHKVKTKHEARWCILTKEHSRR